MLEKDRPSWTKHVSRGLDPLNCRQHAWQQTSQIFTDSTQLIVSDKIEKPKHQNYANRENNNSAEQAALCIPLLVGEKVTQYLVNLDIACDGHIQTPSRSFFLLPPPFWEGMA